MLGRDCWILLSKIENVCGTIGIYADLASATSRETISGNEGDVDAFGVSGKLGHD